MMKQALRKDNFMPGCFVGFALGMVVGVLGGAGVSAAVYYFYLGERLDSYENPAEDMIVTIDAPPVARIGEDFAIRIAVNNPTSEVRQLYQLDLFDELLEGFEPVESDPPFTGSIQGDGYRSFIYTLDLNPGEARVVTLTARPIRAGQIYGRIDICIDTDDDWVSESVDIRILDSAPAPEPTATPAAGAIPF